MSSGVEDIEGSLLQDLSEFDSNKTNPSDDMAAASKEVRQDDVSQVATVRAPTTRADDSVFSLLYSIVKKVTVVGAIYLVGYMNWSV